MQKILISFPLLFLCFSALFGQKRSGFGFGAKAGINVNTYNISFFSSSPDFYTRVHEWVRVGFTGGVFADYIFKNGFGLSMDLLYSKQGYDMQAWSSYRIQETQEMREWGERNGWPEWKGLDTDIELAAERLQGDMHYLNIPILAHYYIVGGLAVKAGFQTGFPLSEKTEYLSTKIGYFSHLSSDRGDWWGSNDVYKTVDISIPVGVSYLFKFGLMIDARYNIGIMGISKNHIGIVNAERKIRSGYFSTTCGYRF